jgi:hypothetical protein
MGLGPDFPANLFRLSPLLCVVLLLAIGKSTSLFVNWEGPRFAVALPKPPRARGPPARIPL